MNASRLTVSPLEHVIRAVEEEDLYAIRPTRAQLPDGLRKALEEMLLPGIQRPGRPCRSHVDAVVQSSRNCGTSGTGRLSTQ